MTPGDLLERYPGVSPQAGGWLHRLVRQGPALRNFLTNPNKG